MALEDRVSMLDQMVLEDDQPVIEGLSAGLYYIAESQTDYADIATFKTKWIEEAPFLRQMQQTLTEGKEYMHMLYTYRSCAKPCPQPKTAEDPMKETIYQRSMEVLEPEIRKLKDFMAFQLRATALFKDIIRRIVEDKKRLWSEQFMLALINMLDLFALLDELKNMKSSLNNDFSTYKRILGLLRRNEESDQENHNLYLFLAHQNSLTTHLKKELHEIRGFTEIISILVNQCATNIEAGRFVTPNEKHCLLRVMPYGLFLMDSETDPLINVFKNKSVSMSRFNKLFKHYPIVPLYGDMHMPLEAPIKRMPHYDERAWTSISDPKVAQEYALITHIAAMRQQHTQFAADFTSLLQTIRSQVPVPSDINFELSTLTVNTVLRGLQLVSDWVGKILLQSAWKYAFPANLPNVHDLVQYELVTRHNYSHDERNALVEAISMIKSVSAMMIRGETTLLPIVGRHIHQDLQNIVQKSIRPLIYYASKKKRGSRLFLLEFREIAADWADKQAPSDTSLFGQKGGNEADFVKIAKRTIGPSPTLHELVRATIYGFLAHRYNARGAPYADKDFGASSSALKPLEEFYHRSFFWPYLRNFGRYLVEMTDLADLWYREFYLELSKRIQFPIEMSLPWILTDEILESHAATMQEYVLFPLDIYNDAGNRALTSLSCQFLFDEIEAEVNLCFEQLLFKLSDKVYSYFKTRACSLLLDAGFRSSMSQLHQTQLAAAAAAGAPRRHHFRPTMNTPRGDTAAASSSSAPSSTATPSEDDSRYNDVWVPPTRLPVIIHQRHFQMLGRTIDLNLLIAQRMISEVRTNIDFAIGRFEAHPITGVVELEHLLRAVRFTYDLLTEHFDLDPWDNIFQEVNNSTSLVSFHNRIALHAIFELVTDFFPNFLFNGRTQRFTRTPLSLADEVEREREPRAAGPKYLFGTRILNSSYQGFLKLYDNFFNLEHIQSMVRMIGKSSLPLIVQECLNALELKIDNVLSPYVGELSQGMPPKLKLPIHDYGTKGCFEFFRNTLQDIMSYSELRTDVFLHFKEFGNTVLFLQLLDQAQREVHTDEFVFSAPLLGFSPTTFSAYKGIEPTAASPLYFAVHSLATAFQSGGAKCLTILNDLVSTSWRVDGLYRPPRENYSLFAHALQRIGQIIDKVRPTWTRSSPTNGVIDMETSLEFYRLWSAMEYVYCFPTSKNELAAHELFGDGLLWSGATIMHFLDQRRRYEIFDFTRHVINVDDAAKDPTPTDDNPDNQNLHQFFQKAEESAEVMSQVFATLEFNAPRPPPQLMLFHPPDSESTATFIQTPRAASSSSPSGPLPPPITANRDLPPPPPRAEATPPPPPPRGADATPPPPPPRGDSLPPPPPPR